jgi:hypothetical protein
MRCGFGEVSPLDFRRFEAVFLTPIANERTCAFAWEIETSITISTYTRSRLCPVHTVHVVWTYGCSNAFCLLYGFSQRFFHIECSTDILGTL